MLEYLRAELQWTCGQYDAGVHNLLAAINRERYWLTPQGEIRHTWIRNHPSLPYNSGWVSVEHLASCTFFLHCNGELYCEDGSLVACSVRAVSLHHSGHYAYVQCDNQVTICWNNTLCQSQEIAPEPIGQVVMCWNTIYFQLAVSRTWLRWEPDCPETMELSDCNGVIDSMWLRKDGILTYRNEVHPTASPVVRLLNDKTSDQGAYLALLSNGSVYQVHKKYAISFELPCVAAEVTDDYMYVLLSNGECRRVCP